MYCNYCGTQNPDDSSYCRACGRDIKFLASAGVTPHEAESPVSSLREIIAPSATSAPREFPAAYQSPSPGQTQTSQTFTARTSIAEDLEVNAPQRPTASPYAMLVCQALAVCFVFSVSIFTACEGPAISRPSSFAIAVVSLCFAIVVAWGIRKTWLKIVVTETSDGKAASRRRRFLTTTIVMMLLYCGLAGALGFVIGQNRVESIQFDLDTGHQKELASRITQARSAVESNIPSFLQMYKAIDPDVKDYAATLLSVNSELVIYDRKFPAQHAETEKYQASVDKEIRRAQLLTKQIAMATKIEPIDLDHQLQLWRDEMMPLLKEEDALDNLK